MDDVYVTMPVDDHNGRIGAVANVLRDAVDEAARVMIQRDDGGMMTLAPGMYTVHNGVLRLNQAVPETGADGGARGDRQQTRPLPTGSAQSAPVGTTQAMDLAPGEEVRIPVLREEAVIGTREVERGGVRVHKTVDEREEVVQQPTFHEDVDVERIPIGRVVDAAPEVREEGDTLIIPVMEEMLVVEKRLVLKEELRITRRRTTQTEEARVVLRQENVQIERIDEREAGV